MNEVSTIKNYPVSTNVVNNKVVNFRASGEINNQKMYTEDKQVDQFIKQQEKARKNTKRQQNFSNFVLGAIAVGSIGSLVFLAHTGGLFGKKVQRAIEKDISNKKTLKELALGKELQEQTDEIKMMIERKDIFREKGLKSMPPIFVYSEPGAGKNAWVYGLAKDTNSKLFEVNVLEFNDMYNGQSENNILKFIKNAAKEARKNPNQTVIVYFDEIDSIALKDNSVNANFTNKLHNAFKTGFNELLEIPNVQIIGSSNKACKEEALTTLLDDAIMNRFGKKIFVPLPNSEQLQNTIKEFLNNKVKNKGYVDAELLSDNETVKKLCDYLSQEGHHISFRDLESIIDKAVCLSEKEGKGTPIKINHIQDAVIDKANQLNWAPEEIEAFKATL